MIFESNQNKQVSLLPVLFQTLVVSLGFFFFGYNFVIFNILEQPLSEIYNWSQEQQRFNIALGNCLYFVGNVTGSILAGKVSQKLTKREIMILGCWVGLVSHILQCVVNNYLLIMTRIGAGLAASLLNNCIPSYVAEIVPKDKIGMFSGIYHLYLPFGVSVGVYLAVFLPNTQNNSQNSFIQNQMWRIILLVPALIVFILLVSLLFFYRLDTPYELMRNQQTEELVKSQLAKSYHPQSEQFLFEYESLQRRCQQQSQSITLKQLLSPQYIRQFSLALLLNSAMQFGGIAIIQSYSVSILKRTENLDYQTSIRFTTIYAIMRIIFNFVNMAIMDQIGKKKLLVISLISQAISLFMMGLFDHLEIRSTQQYLLIIYFIFFSLGIDKIVWVITADLVFGFGFGICVCANFGFSSLFTLVFPYLRDGFLGYYGFLYCISLLTFSSCLVFIFYLPETNNMNFQQVYELFNNEQNDKKDMELKDIALLHDHMKITE